ncbi:hypothetical protein BASA81_002130 [Batrachochytrium salamandrivorans]|nr:hypothetical protein BASA81_002130 [Batrachochytrium salamandrivorans]
MLRAATVTPPQEVSPGKGPLPPSALLDSEAINNQWNKYLLDNRITKEEQAYTGETSLKAARVLGEFQLANPSAKLSRGGLFSGNEAECVRLANKQLYLDKKRRRDLNDQAISSFVLGTATPGQLEIPSTAQSSVKALQILGNAEVLAPIKARNVLGMRNSAEDEDCRAMADKQWHEDMARKTQAFTNKVLLQRPTPSVLEIQAPVSDKALAFFGDSHLVQQSQRALSPGAERVKPKAVQVFGEPFLAGRKAQSLLLDEHDLELQRRPCRRATMC